MSCFCCCCDRRPNNDISEPLIPNPYTPPDPVVIRRRGILVRREFQALNQQEKDRFFRALSHMIKPTTLGEPQYFSPFFQIASYNRWPMNFNNNIPPEMKYLWYRAYLHDFEVALQTADATCGGDGKITLPYINVKANYAIPSQVRQFTFPEEYLQANEELKHMNIRICADTRDLANIEIHRGMLNEELNAVTERVLDAYGFNTEFAAFTPAFYLVLCYLDKINDRYRNDKLPGITPKSIEYWKILVPFRKLPMELIDIKNLGYTY